MPGSPLQTPIVAALQNAADGAVAGQTLPTHLVVVRPGTGEILAVSSNAAADTGNALGGHFPPGSSMKTITATALLSARALDPDPPVPCPGTTVVDGREFENQDQFDLGTVSVPAGVRGVVQHDLHPAGARPARSGTRRCGGRLRRRQRLAAAGRHLQRQRPERQHRDDEGRQRHRAGRGADEPGRAGPGGRRRRERQPRGARRGLDAEAAGPSPAGPGPQVLEALRSMMREVVLSGTATALGDRGEVYGKTGTAEFGSNTPPDAHGWFMGYRLGGPQGDVAFAVLVEGGQSSSTAVAVTDAFLGASDGGGSGLSGRPGKARVTGV